MKWPLFRGIPKQPNLFFKKNRCFTICQSSVFSDTFLRHFKNQNNQFAICTDLHGGCKLLRRQTKTDRWDGNLSKRGGWSSPLKHRWEWQEHKKGFRVPYQSKAKFVFKRGPIETPSEGSRGQMSWT